MEIDRYRLPHIAMEEVSEAVRIYSSRYVGDSMAQDVVSGILSHPYVESATVTVGEPTLGVMVTVTAPEHWDKYIDPYCRDCIGMAMEAQASEI
jgi:hypothetical protein